MDSTDAGSAAQCIEPGCPNPVESTPSGRGRPRLRCEVHRKARKREIDIRHGRRARAGMVRQGPPRCVDCGAVIEWTPSPKGGRAPERCPEHKRTHRNAVRRRSRLGLAPHAPVVLLPLPEPKPVVRTSKKAAGHKPAPRCGCGTRLRGEKAHETGLCLRCRAPAPAPKCACGRTLRGAHRRSVGVCSRCEEAQVRGQARAKRESGPRCTGCGRRLGAAHTIARGLCWRCGPRPPPEPQYVANTVVAESAGVPEPAVETVPAPVEPKVEVRRCVAAPPAPAPVAAMTPSEKGNGHVGAVAPDPEPVEPRPKPRRPRKVRQALPPGEARRRLERMREARQLAEDIAF